MSDHKEKDVGGIELASTDLQMSHKGTYYNKLMGPNHQTTKS